MATDVGVDLGTASVLIFVRGKGVVLREPSVVAVAADTGRVVAVGEEARRMLGRTPGSIVAVRPLREGVIADFDLTEAMLHHFLARVLGRRTILRPSVVVCIPSACTAVERRAVIEATMRAGASRALVIQEPLAAALGAGLDLTQPRGHLVCDIGGGTTDVAVISLGGVVTGGSVRVGGDRCDEAIVRYLRLRHNLGVGERTAEELKITIGTAAPDLRRDEAEVRGRDLVTGLPRSVKVTSADLAEAMAEPLAEILHLIREVLERTPPELAADIAEQGLVLTGGGALLHGMDVLISRETGLAVHIPDDPISCVARGTGRALDFLACHPDHVDFMRKISVL